MNLHFASLWEAISDTVPDRPALVCAQRSCTWREFDDRASRLATVFAEHGIGPGSKVGLYLHNSNAYLESQFAVFKSGACPINVNYRYKADELVYLLDNADAEAVVYQACYAMRVWEIRDRLPKVKLFLQVDDGTETLLQGALDFESAAVRSAPAPRRAQADNDIYMLYTGGTTGMPKGVMYELGAFSAGIVGMAGAMQEVEAPSDLSSVSDFIGRLEPRVSLPACPLMHGTGMWLGAMLPLAGGGTVVTSPKLGLDPDRLLGLVATHRVTDLVIVGDAFAKPLLGALDHARDQGSPFDLSSLRQIISSGVMWSAEVKRGLLDHHDMMLVDLMGSTEGGMGSSVSTREGSADTAKFQLNEGVRVFADDGSEVAPGSGVIGRIATSGMVPVGYYKDPEKSAETFRTIDGVRYSFPGDYATVEADGTVTLLGRGSVCINTGGEKVFPEEVEEAVKRCPGVFDCLTVGVPDERFGERVVAVVSLRAGAQIEEQGVVDFARSELAGYKLPKNVLFVPEVRRAPNGKADYKWAKRTALAELR